MEVECSKTVAKSFLINKIVSNEAMCIICILEIYSFMEQQWMLYLTNLSNRNNCKLENQVLVTKLHWVYMSSNINLVT